MLATRWMVARWPGIARSGGNGFLAACSVAKSPAEGKLLVAWWQGSWLACAEWHALAPATSLCWYGGTDLLQFAQREAKLMPKTDARCLADCYDPRGVGSHQCLALACRPLLSELAQSLQQKIHRLLLGNMLYRQLYFMLAA
ncbi:hypothetical protein MMC07_009453 [Pseudocyphellaria aurata]|nr:hypothetical protein [Pseudocyphellaria aurata]